MENIHPIDNEHEEIGLDDPRGWKLFLEYAADAHKELEAFSTQLGGEQVESHLQKADSDYLKLEELVESSISALENEEEITAVQAEKAQELYDAIVESRDKLEVLAEQQNKEAQSEVAQIKVVHSESTGWSSDDEIDESEISFDADKEEDLGSSVDDEGEINEEEKIAESRSDVLNQIKSSQVEAENLTERYKSQTESLSDEQFKEKILFRQLGVTLERIHKIKKELSEAEEITLDLIERKQEEAEEIEKNVKHISVRLKEVFEGVEEGEEIDEEQESTGLMKIATEEETEKDVAIKLIEKPQEDEPEEIVQQKKPSLDDLRENKEAGKNSFITENLKRNPHIKEILKEHNISWQQVERNLKKTIIETEKPSQLDVFLKVKQGSLFVDLLSPMTMKQLSKFEHRTGEDIKADLTKLQKEKGKQYEYRIYRAWLDAFDDMSAVVPLHPDTTFGELCTLFELVKLLPEEDVETE